jgi:hypothetical protein
MNPPMVVEVTIPNPHNTNRMMNMVQSIVISFHRRGQKNVELHLNGQRFPMNLRRIGARLIQKIFGSFDRIRGMRFIE